MAPHRPSGNEPAGRPQTCEPKGFGGGSLGRRGILKGFLGVLALAAVGVGLDACSEGDPVLRVGLLPDQSEADLRRVYGPLFDHVAQHAGVRYTFTIPGSYAELVALFETGRVDVAYFGALTFVKAAKSGDALPLVMRDVDRSFMSTFLVSANNPAESLKDLRGSTFSFGAKLSTSGHLMPRHFMLEQGIDPEIFFSEVVYSGAHDRTARSVQNGTIECGVLNAEIAKRMFAEGALDPSRVRILWETPPYPDYVWAIRGGVSDETRIRLRDAFLSLQFERPAHRSLLEPVGARAFLPARVNNFETVKQVAESLGLL